MYIESNKLTIDYFDKELLILTVCTLHSIKYDYVTSYIIYF